MEITAISPFKQPEVVEAIASVYQQAFGGDPWNEGYLCPLCGSVYARVTGIKVCPACTQGSREVLVVEYWPKSIIVSDFYREMCKPDALCLVAYLKSEIIGFAWGYRVFVNQEYDSYVEAPNLHKLLQGDFFYLDECALVPEYQGKGLGTVLAKHIFREQKERRVLLRTMNSSRMCTMVQHAGGEIVQHISRGRVIMQLLTS
jgi:GNAT superfamily N-acetyltransferase